MKAKGAMIQGALALVGLGAAWATWQREPERAAGEVVVVDAGKNDVDRVRFDEGKSWVELRRVRSGPEAGVWLKLSAQSKAPEREVRGNEAAERLFDSFSPLRASRSLGVFEAPRLKEFGLAAPDAPDGGAAPATTWKRRRLVVKVHGDERTFTLGTPPGAFTTYLRDERDGRVYVLGGSLLSDLQSASTRMVERQLHRFKQGDFDEVVAEAGGKRRELIVLSPEQPTNFKLASKEAPGKPDDTARNWHGRVFMLFPVEVLGKGEVPAAGVPQPMMKVTWRAKGEDKGWLEIGKVTPVAAQVAPPPETSAPPPPTPPAEYYARSERTAGWVKLGAGAEDVVKEADKVVAAQ